MTLVLNPNRAGRIYIECEGEGCRARCDINAVGAHKTRLHAQRQGWEVRGHDGGQDLCPFHRDYRS